MIVYFYTRFDIQPLYTSRETQQTKIILAAACGAAFL